jgi:Met-zincin/Domain of unknown function (DUF5117)
MKRTAATTGLFLLSASLAMSAPPAGDASPKVAPTIADKTQGMQKLPGFLTDYWDARQGKIWLEIREWNAPFLYIESLPNGVGSNDIGLDRGQPGETQVVHFERSGPKVLLVAENTGYRAVTDDPDQRQAVHEAFAQSVLWGFEAAAADGGAVLVDATAFFLRDAHGIAERLEAIKQGSYKVDPARSAIFLPRTRSFPDNTVVESILTLEGTHGGTWVQEVTPRPGAITVHERFSFVKSPASGFRPRVYDPRSGFIDTEYMDFAVPVDQAVTRRLIVHLRLDKKDPSAPLGEATRPIVYYVDRAIPEPIRSAVVEGAGWWNQAFTAAGYKDAFRVELLPEGVDPMDIRYNVIEWTPRRTRGWAYGTAIVDPRTGEIVNGHVTFDALRIRQDFLIAQGLLDPFGTHPEALKQANEMALARIRQLAAHETGHTLGLVHNYAGSIVDRASVMDYPPPVVTLDGDGAPDVSQAYAVGIGAWDKVAIDYGYRDFPPGSDEAKELPRILNDAFSRGLLFLTDDDARPSGSASPIAHLWDQGPDPLEGLKQVMAVRAAALRRLSSDAISDGAPLATLEDVLTPIFLYHRYQVAAAAKMIGGLSYSFNLRGGVQKPPEIVPADRQRQAIQAVLATLGPSVLAVPDALLDAIPPRPPGYPDSRENFERRTTPAFDALAPAEAAAEIVVGFVLDPARAQRMIEYHARDSRNPGFSELLGDLLTATWRAASAPGYSGAIQRTVDSVVLAHLMSLGADGKTPPQVRATISLALDELKGWTAGQLAANADKDRRALLFLAQQDIERFEKDPAGFHAPARATPPAGDPIGDDDGSWPGARGR